MNLSMIQTAVREPDRVLPFLRDRYGSLPTDIASSADAWAGIATLPTQRRRLNEFRDGDSWMLIVLDACRADYFCDVFAEDFNGDIDTVRSEARDTFEWLSTCWSGEWKMPYVSGAVPVNNRELDFEDDFLRRLYDGYQPTEHLHDIHPVWRTGWDPSLGCCPPEPVVESVRNIKSDRVVVHFQQPHSPYIGEEQELGHSKDYSAKPLQGEPTDKPIWERVKRGEISDHRLCELYRSNLERCRPAVLETVALGLERFDRVAITADHGEALGEWNVYAHPRTPEHRAVRRVPWVEVTDLEADWEYVGQKKSEAADMAVQERLEALGYR